MVKSVTVLLLTLCFAVPVLAQDDYPRIETSFAYSNTGIELGGLLPGHHSGFSNISGLNLYRWMGIENFMGYYGLGSGVSLFADTFGARLTARQISRFVPYVSGGVGVGYFSSGGGTIGGSNFATRVGFGVDVPINETISWKVDVSRLSIKTSSITGESWSSGATFTTGVVLNIGQ